MSSSFIQVLEQRKETLLTQLEAELQDRFEAEVKLLEQKKEQLELKINALTKQQQAEVEAKKAFFVTKAERQTELSFKKQMIREVITDSVKQYLQDTNHHQAWLEQTMKPIKNVSGTITSSNASLSLLKKIGSASQTIAEDAALSLGFIFENDEVRIEATLESLVDSVYPVLETEIAQILFEED
jgi:hypothetical protein